MAKHKRGIISLCTPADLHLVCEDCGHDPCDCDMQREAHDKLYGFNCPDCGERLLDESSFHDCIGQDRYYNPLEEDA